MTDRWVTRGTLLRRAKDPNDEQAWEEFEAYYKGFIRNVLTKLTFRPSDRDDLQQLILVGIWKSLETFDSSGEQKRFRSWLTGLIRHKVLDYLRKTYRYDNRKEKACDMYMADLMPESEMERVVRDEWEEHMAQTALNNIKDKFSGAALKAFELSLDGKSSREIGEEINVNHESVRTLKNRVKKRLIKEIEQLREELEF